MFLGKYKFPNNSKRVPKEEVILRVNFSFKYLIKYGYTITKWYIIR